MAQGKYENGSEKGLKRLQKLRAESRREKVRKEETEKVIQVHSLEGLVGHLRQQLR